MGERTVRVTQSPAAHNGARAGDATLKNTAAKPVEDKAPCGFCGGTGWREVITEPDRRVTRCDCFLQEQARRFLDLARIPARYGDCEFSNYDTGENQSLAAAKIAIEKWAAQYPLDRTGLLLVGPSGVWARPICPLRR